MVSQGEPVSPSPSWITSAGSELTAPPVVAPTRHGASSARALQRFLDVLAAAGGRSTQARLTRELGVTTARTGQLAAKLEREPPEEEAEQERWRSEDEQEMKRLDREDARREALVARECLREMERIAPRSPQLSPWNARSRRPRARQRRGARYRRSAARSRAPNGDSEPGEPEPPGGQIVGWRHHSGDLASGFNWRRNSTRRAGQTRDGYADDPRAAVLPRDGWFVLTILILAGTARAAEPVAHDSRSLGDLRRAPISIDLLRCPPGRPHGLTQPADRSRAPPLQGL